MVVIRQSVETWGDIQCHITVNHIDLGHDHPGLPLEAANAAIGVQDPGYVVLACPRRNTYFKLYIVPRLNTNRASASTHSSHTASAARTPPAWLEGRSQREVQCNLGQRLLWAWTHRNTAGWLPGFTTVSELKGVAVTHAVAGAPCATAYQQRGAGAFLCHKSATECSGTPVTAFCSPISACSRHVSCEAAGYGTPFYG